MPYQMLNSSFPLMILGFNCNCVLIPSTLISLHFARSMKQWCFLRSYPKRLYIYTFCCIKLSFELLLLWWCFWVGVFFCWESQVTITISADMKSPGLKNNHLKLDLSCSFLLFCFYGILFDSFRFKLVFVLFYFLAFLGFFSCTYCRNHDNNSSTNAVVYILTWKSFRLDFSTCSKLICSCLPVIQILASGYVISSAFHG